MDKTLTLAQKCEQLTLHLSNMITRAKWKMLNEIQSKVEDLYKEQQIPDGLALDRLGKLMDYHDRIKDTPNSALNFRAGLNFLNSLLLPLLAFVIANLKDVLSLLRPIESRRSSAAGIESFQRSTSLIGLPNDQTMPPSFQTTQIHIPEGFIDLGRGDPQLALLPLDLLNRAAGQRLSQSDNSFLQYGPEQGDGYLRTALASFLADGDASSADPDRLFITAGISSALDLLCTLFTRSGDTIFVEEPSYFLALQIFADHGLRVVPIPTDGSGLVIDALEAALNAHRPKFLYTIPVFQNPSGHTLPQERRERLLSLSREYDFLLLADEVYQYLHYITQPPRCFGSYGDFENVVSLGSFSKILAPGLRLGWIQAAPSLIQRLAGCGLLNSGGGMNPFTSAIVRGLIESGDLQKNIARLVATYSARVQSMDAGLKHYLPEAEFTAPQGGYFFWVRLPGCDADVLRKEAQARQTDFRPGILFSSQAGLRDYIRLSVSFYDGEDIDLGLNRLGQAPLLFPKR